MKAVNGRRDALIALLLDGVNEMPGCLCYVVAIDPADDDGIWITEVWDTAESHRGSLALPKVKQTIEKAMPLIAGFDSSVTTIPVGGFGI